MTKSGSGSGGGSGQQGAAMIAPCALNVYKKIPIIRRPTDTVSFEDTDGSIKYISISDLGDAVISTTPLVKKKPKHEIPVPQINIVASYAKDVPANYDIPHSYIRYHRRTEKEWKNELDYVADGEDEAWLESNTKFGGAAVAKHIDGKQSIRPPQLSLDLFERILDLFEKATAFDTIITIQQAEELVLSKIPEITELFPLKGRGLVKLKQVLNDVYSYWVSKRSKLKRPLLRRYWPVTSTDDTNPHLVFRPREKEKYKLRKKRQNDLDAFHKMKQLRNDFDNLRAVLELVKRREELNHLHAQLQVELFQQRLYEVVDTSGLPRVATRLSTDHVKRVLDVPIHFDVQFGGRKAKRIRETDEATSSATSTRAQPTLSSTLRKSITDVPNVAGRNHGEPAPHFLQPLATRETFVTSWDTAVPYVTSYADSHALPTFRFRHRPRVGRGGRVCIDRLPVPPSYSMIPVPTIYRAGLPLPQKPQQQLLDLLPRPLDEAKLHRRLQELTVSLLQDDMTATAVSAGDPLEDNDGDQVIVKLDDYLETDEQIWGEERFIVGPI